MKNEEISRILHELGFLSAMEDDPNAHFKARAYHKAADTIGSMSEDVVKIYRESGIEGLLGIQSIGKAVASKLEELITAGKISHLEELRSGIPIEVEELDSIPGLGLKTIKVIYEKLGIKDLSSLEKAAVEGRLHSIPGISEKKERSILKHIRFTRETRGKYLIGEIFPLVREIEISLSSFDEVQKVLVVGSIRRMKETVHNINYLVASSHPDRVIKQFVALHQVQQIVGRENYMVRVRLSPHGIRSDLLVVQEENFGAASILLTGSKEHVDSVRKIAHEKNYSLKQNGFYGKQGTRLSGAEENDVYDKLGLGWIPPEIREGKGEIELAARHSLPPLIDYGSVRGDLQVHSNNTDGTMSIEDMAHAAAEKCGLDYIAITDHTKSLAIAHGLDERQLLGQSHRIAVLNDRLEGFRVFSGAEVNIMKDGTLDISANVLDKLEVVGASIHTHFTLGEEEQTDRLIKAANNPNVDIIFHPTGRIINRRTGYPVDMDKVIEVAKDTKTVLEINAHYNRLDLKEDYIRKAVDSGVKLVIDTDAHHPTHFSFIIFGIGQARRGWAKGSDILNTLPAESFLKALK